MDTLTLTTSWIALPFLLGFSIYLIPKLHKFLAFGGVLASLGFAAQILIRQAPQSTLELLGNFGVTLTIDTLSAYFILTNALVSAAVILYCWGTDKKAFFYIQALILHGSVNAAFVSSDFISLYVALEVSGIAGFLLISYPRSDRSIWVALRYLFVGNIAMLFYLVGAVLVYQASNSFKFQGLGDAPPEAQALIFLGLLVKGGMFVSGLWLPLTHSEAETPVSALLSGVVVKSGVYPLVRCALFLEEVDPIVRVFGMGTALLGVLYAIFERDTKRTLALSTVSQLGWVIAAPQVAGFYALTHGLGKSALFLSAGSLPSRKFSELHKKPIDTKIWLIITIASFSISGFPLLSGFAAKSLTMDNLLPWQNLVMNIGIIGTTIVYSKFIFLPHQGQVSPATKSKITPGFWVGSILLIVSLIAANGFYLPAYSFAKIAKSIATIVAGWFGYLLIFRRFNIILPRLLEQFDHLIGVMSLMLLLILWMVLP